jgi:hypothetical protein
MASLENARGTDPTFEDEIGDSESDFGSPIKNDTQFNANLGRRTSSPVQKASQASTSSSVSRDQDLETAAVAYVPNYSHDAESSEDGGPIPFPVPRLVPRSIFPTKADASRVTDPMAEEQLPVQESWAATQVSTTKIPLNDVAPSSSPVLPSSKGITQRAIHPASLSRPSQMSTQEATQSYPGHTGMVLGEQVASTPQEPDKVTVKDSSSIALTLSQIPAHETQAGIDIGLEDAAAEEEEYDLDPPSMPSPQMSTNADSQNPDIVSEDRERSCRPRSSPLRERYSPIPGFNNETQSNFTQNGHVTAAYIHRQRENGMYPKSFVPKPYQVPGYTRR